MRLKCLTVEAEREAQRCSSECCHCIPVIVRLWLRSWLLPTAEWRDLKLSLCSSDQNTPELSRASGIPRTNECSLESSSTQDEQNWFMILDASGFNL